ncbi:MAG: MFS transporter [Acidimicrobiales bacterium]
MGPDKSRWSKIGAAAGWDPLRRPARPRISHTPFGRLAAVHVLAIAGDTFVTMALAGSLFFSISPDAARNRVALYLFLTVAPFAVVAPWLGPLLDRSRNGRRSMLIASCAGRAVVCLFMARHIESLLLFPEAFVVLVLSKSYSITKSALVPATVPDEARLVEANSRLALLAVLAGFVAAIPGAAVLKIGFLGAPWVMRLASLGFAAAAVAGIRLARVPVDRSAPTVTLAEEKAELHTAAIRLSVTAMAVLRASVGFLVFLTAFAFRRDDTPAWWFGAVLAASMAGSFLGAAVAPRLRRAVHEERILAGSLVAVAVVGGFAASAGGRASFAFLAAVMGAAAGAGKLAFDSIVQRDAPDAVRGRTFARLETRFQVVWVIGAAIPVVFPIPGWLGMGVIALASAVGFLVYVTGLAATRRSSAAG